MKIFVGLLWPVFLKASVVLILPTFSKSVLLHSLFGYVNIGNLAPFQLRLARLTLNVKSIKKSFLRYLKTLPMRPCKSSPPNLAYGPPSSNTILKNSALLVKKITLYAERNEEKRKKFSTEIAKFNPADLIYIDESGIDEFLQRDYARSARGKEVISDVYGRKYGRLSVIAAYCPHTKELIAPFVFEGHTDAKRFNGWLEKCLLPELERGKKLVMDNATFHKSRETKEIIKAKGCDLIFQPAYSPDLNPIEQQWAIIKSKFRKYKHLFNNFNDAVDYAFIA